jgi:hypothetical protein
LYTISRTTTTTTTIRNNNNDDNNDDDDDDEREKRKTIYIYISICIFLKQNVYAIDDETAIAGRN